MVKKIGRILILVIAVLVIVFSVGGIFAARTARRIRSSEVNLD